MAKLKKQYDDPAYAYTMAMKRFDIQKKILSLPYILSSLFIYIFWSIFHLLRRNLNSILCTPACLKRFCLRLTPINSIEILIEHLLIKRSNFITFTSHNIYLINYYLRSSPVPEIYLTRTDPLIKC